MPTSTPSDLFSALFQAAYDDDANAISSLIRLGADPRQAHPSNHMTPLQIAAENARIHAIEALLPLSDPNHQDQRGMTALMGAAQNNRTYDASSYFALLPHTNASLIDSNGLTLLHHAAAGGNPQIILSALSICDPDATDLRGITPLHIASWQRYPAPLQLATPANIFLKNNEGHTAIDIYKKLLCHSQAQQLSQYVDAVAEKANLQQTLSHAQPNPTKPKL